MSWIGRASVGLKSSFNAPTLKGFGTWTIARKGESVETAKEPSREKSCDAGPAKVIHRDPLPKSVVGKVVDAS